MCPTPPLATTDPQPATHHFEFDGAARAPLERTRTEVTTPLPNVTETTVQSILHIGDNATLVRYVSESVLYPAPVDRLVFSATVPRASICVSKGKNDTLVIDLNHERYMIKPASAKQIIEIHTRHGDDTIYIADTIKNRLHIETGAGHDTVVSSSGYATIKTGSGDDLVMTREGISYIETADGNDIVNANGSGTVVAYTGKGDDFFRGGTGLAYVDAGQGNDTLTGGQGHNILCGAEGDDLITAGPRSNVIYPGQGSNILNELKQTDTVFTESEPTHLSEGQVITAKEAENTSGRPGPKSFKVSAKPLSESGFIIQGSDEFIERVKNDLTQLLGSGVGHQLLSALTQSIRQSHKPITIAELKHIDSGLYIPNLGDGRSYIKVDKAGLPDFGGTIYYNPSFARYGFIPLVVLYHELCHAYNFVTGTQFQGLSPDGHGGTKAAPQVSNYELQAAGLPCNVAPFDFDQDPTTPALTTNPKPFSENGLREELGLPLRKTYITYSDD